jgi:hypothetical protein
MMLSAVFETIIAKCRNAFVKGVRDTHLITVSFTWHPTSLNPTCGLAIVIVPPLILLGLFSSGPADVFEPINRGSIQLRQFISFRSFQYLSELVRKLSRGP